MVKLRSGAVLVLVAALSIAIGSPPASAGAAPLVINTTSIDFGDVNVGTTSPVMAAVITNTGADPFGPLNIFGGAPPSAEFGASQNCQSVTLPAGGSCSVSYTFSPSAPGVVNDISNFTISGTGSQADGEDFTVALTGTGVNPITAAPTSHDFGNVNVGTTSPSVATVITNTSGDPFGPLNIFGGVPPTADFGASQNCQGVTLPAGGSCSVSYTFSPSAPGVVTDTSSFTISGTASQADGEDFTVALTGCGVLTGDECPPAPTTTTLDSSVNPSVSGQPVTFTATVDVVSVPDVPTGSVSFVDVTTGSALGTVTLDATGQATLTTSALVSGSHTIQATYTPDSTNFGGSSDSLTQVVEPASTTITLSTSPNPSMLGRAFTLTAEVTAPSPSQGSPTGSVTVVDVTTGATLGTAPVNSQATLTIDSLVVGTHVLRVTFTPNTANFTSSSADIRHTVVAPARPTQPGFETPARVVAVRVAPRFTG